MSEHAPLRQSERRPVQLTGRYWKLGDGRLAEDYGRGLVPVENRGVCDVMRGDGSIPQSTCILPVGHEGPHYG